MGVVCLGAGPLEQSGFGLVEESEANQVFEFRPGASDVLGHHGQIQREAHRARSGRSSWPKTCTICW
jgi:hypothetical protein